MESRARKKKSCVEKKDVVVVVGEVK